MLNPQTILLYDGTFDGFLCSVFIIYTEKITDPIIRKQSQTHNQLFTVIEAVTTQRENAKRVWNGFKKKTTKNQQRDFFKAFLSEIKGVENTLFNYMKTIFKNKYSKNIDFSNSDILKISQVARMVNREKHRMEVFVRFQHTKDGIYFATVSPDFNVLPLITNHFKDRYADQKWLIFDTSRTYGIYYNLLSVEIITFQNMEKLSSQILKKNMAPLERDFQKLWQIYYQNVNIKSRKNKKLHLQHLPKRYWKYLTEKENTNPDN